MYTPYNPNRSHIYPPVLPRDQDPGQTMSPDRIAHANASYYANDGNTHRTASPHDQADYPQAVPYIPNSPYVQGSPGRPPIRKAHSQSLDPNAGYPPAMPPTFPPRPYPHTYYPPPHPPHPPHPLHHTQSMSAQHPPLYYPSHDGSRSQSRTTSRSGSFSHPHPDPTSSNTAPVIYHTDPNIAPGSRNNSRPGSRPLSRNPSFHSEEPTVHSTHSSEVPDAVLNFENGSSSFYLSADSQDGERGRAGEGIPPRQPNPIAISRQNSRMNLSRQNNARNNQDLSLVPLGDIMLTRQNSNRFLSPNDQMEGNNQQRLHREEEAEKDVEIEVDVPVKKNRKEVLRSFIGLCLVIIIVLVVVVGFILLIIFLAGLFNPKHGNNDGNIVDDDDNVLPIEVFPAAVASCSSWLSVNCQSNQTLYVLDNVYAVVNYTDLVNSNTGRRRMLIGDYVDLSAPPIPFPHFTNQDFPQLVCNASTPLPANLRPINISRIVPGTSDESFGLSVVCTTIIDSTSLAIQALQYSFSVPTAAPGIWTLSIAMTDTLHIKQNITISLRSIDNDSIVTPYYALYNTSGTVQEAAVALFANLPSLITNISMVDSMDANPYNDNDMVDIYLAVQNISISEIYTAAQINPNVVLTPTTVIIFGECYAKLTDLLQSFNSLVYNTTTDFTSPLYSTSNIAIDPATIYRLSTSIGFLDTAMSIIRDSMGVQWEVGAVPIGVYVYQVVKASIERDLARLLKTYIDMSGKIVKQPAATSSRRLAIDSTSSSLPQADDVGEPMQIDNEEYVEESTSSMQLDHEDNNNDQFTVSSIFSLTALPTITLSCGNIRNATIPIIIDKFNFASTGILNQISPIFISTALSSFSHFESIETSTVVSETLFNYLEYSSVLTDLTELFTLNQTYYSYVAKASANPFAKLVVNTVLQSIYCSTYNKAYPSNRMNVTCQCPGAASFPIPMSVQLTSSYMLNPAIKPTYTTDGFLQQTVAPPDNDDTVAPVWRSIYPIKRNWTALATTTTGDIVYAGIAKGSLYKSIDYGDTWTKVGNSTFDYKTMKCTTDGSIVYVATGNLYKSVDGGVNWSLILAPPSSDKLNRTVWNYNSVAISSTGQVVYTCNIEASITTSLVYIAATVRKSSDYGATWTTLPISTSLQYPIDIACSGDGNILYLAVANDMMYVSTNGGSTWTRVQTETYLSIPYTRSVSSLSGNYGLGIILDKSYYFQPVYRYQTTTYLNYKSFFVTAGTMSADGKVVFVICASTGKSKSRICSSTDFGQTFSTSYALLQTWSSIIISHDSKRVYAAVRGGGIYAYTFNA